MYDPAPSASAFVRYRDFELLEEIGAGAFARVYRVRAPGHARPLALKLSAHPRLTAEMIKRAVREVSILRSLTNPHVARLHGSSIGPDHFYILMDYLEGQQLDHHHDLDEPMAVGDAIKIVLQVCMGLAEAHAAGVVHRDIKPANIWIQPDGTVKILDFGLARAWDVPWAYGTNATAAHTVVGTPHYCQPEQLHSEQLTPASDVYSLATILYELLSGHAVLFEHRRVSQVREALRDSPVAWLEAHVTRPVVPIRRRPGCAELPDRLVRLLRWALAKKPDARPPDAGAFARTLGDILYEDLGAVGAARLQMLNPDHEPESLVVVPGRRILGSADRCDLQLRGPGIAPVHAILDWSGSPRTIQIRPMPSTGDTAVLTLDGKPVHAPTALGPDDLLQVGEQTCWVHYP
jgi:serine/threonine-protein kinase